MKTITLTKEEGNAKPYVVGTKYSNGPTVYHVIRPTASVRNDSRNIRRGLRVSLDEGMQILRELYQIDAEIAKLGGARHFLVWVEHRY